MCKIPSNYLCSCSGFLTPYNSAGRQCTRYTLAVVRQVFTVSAPLDCCERCYYLIYLDYVWARQQETPTLSEAETKPVPAHCIVTPTFKIGFVLCTFFFKRLSLYMFSPSKFLCLTKTKNMVFLARGPILYNNRSRCMVFLDTERATFEIITQYTEPPRTPSL